MNPILKTDMALVSDTLNSQGIAARLRPFGSAHNGLPRGNQDIDLALVVADRDKVRALEILRNLGVSGRRLMNWRIDVFDATHPSYGYNNSKHPGWLHWLVLGYLEAEGSTPLAANIRLADGQPPQP